MWKIKVASIKTKINEHNDRSNVHHMQVRSFLPLKGEGCYLFRGFIECDKTNCKFIINFETNNIPVNRTYRSRFEHG